MLKNIVYISSDNRSGSTMLDLILANNSDVFSAGELHNLPAYVFNDRSFFNPNYELNCICGESVHSCSFWQSVEKNLPVSFQELRLRAENPGATGFDRFMNDKYCAIDWRVRANVTWLLKSKLYQRLSGAQIIAKNYFLLYEAIAKVSGKKIIVDSSKWPFRFRHLYDYQPEKVKIIFLHRHPNAVVYSKIKRGRDLKKSAIKWNNLVSDMDMFSREIPDAQKISVCYEDICAHPEKEISRICSFLEINYTDQMSNLRKTGIHHIGGSSSKYDTSKTDIQADRLFASKLTQDQMSCIKSLTKNSRSIPSYNST